MNDEKEVCKKDAYGQHFWERIDVHVKWTGTHPEVFEILRCTQCKKAKMIYLELI